MEATVIADPFLKLVKMLQATAEQIYLLIHPQTLGNHLKLSPASGRGGLMLWVSAAFESLAGVMASQLPWRSRHDSEGRFVAT